MFKKLTYFLPTFWQCWLIVLLLSIAGGILSFILAVFTKNQVLIYITTFLPAILYVWLMGNKAAAQQKEAVAIDSSRELSAKSIFIVTLLLSLATLLLAFILDPATDLVPMPEYLKEGLYKEILTDPFRSLISIAVAAPILEEFIVRGVILRGLLHHISPVKAIIWSAFIFAVIHLNMYQALGAFLMGLFFGWVYYKSGSLLFTILLHFVNNLFSYSMVFFFPDIDVEQAIYKIIIENSGIVVYIICYLLSLLLFGAITVWLNKNLKKDWNAKKETISL